MVHRKFSRPRMLLYGITCIYLYAASGVGIPVKIYLPNIDIEEQNVQCTVVFIESKESLVKKHSVLLLERSVESESESQSFMVLSQLDKVPDGDILLYNVKWRLYIYRFWVWCFTWLLTSCQAKSTHIVPGPRKRCLPVTSWNCTSCISSGGGGGRGQHCRR